MKSNNLIVLSIGLALSFSQGTRAQSLDDYSALRTELDAMFEDLDKSKIITGLLLDYAVDLVDLSLFDGENMSDSSLVNFATLQYILSSIRSAAPVTAPFQDVSVIRDTLSARNLRTGHIPICVAAFDYNQIRADALTNNLIISFSGTDPDGYIIPTVSVPLHDTGFPHGAIIVGPTGILQVDDGDGNTSLIPVRGPAEEISLTVEVGDVILSYTHIPSQSEILEDLVKEPSFVERLKQIEPWGKSPFMIIPYSITDNVTGTKTDCSFKFIFNPRINGN